MSEIFNLNNICRCCHSQGNFKHLKESYLYNGQEEVYSNILQQTFNIEVRYF